MQKVIISKIAAIKKEAAELVRFANPKTRAKTMPTVTRVFEILEKKIPYRSSEKRPAIMSIKDTKYHANKIQKSATIIVEASDGKTYEFTAYQSLIPQSQEEREADKKAAFPRGLFKIFRKVV